MFSKSLDTLKRASRRLGFRLGAWHLAVFLAGNACVLGLAYIGLSASLQKGDRAEILSELAEQEAIYKAGGLPAMRRDLAQGGGPASADWFYIEVKAASGATAVISPLKPGLAYDTPGLGRPAIPGEPRWDLLPEKVDDTGDLEAASLLLPDGAVLRVARNTADRDALLEHFRDTALLILLPAALLGLLGGVLLTRRALLPLHQLAGTVREIETGTLESRVTLRGTGDELDELGGLFNRMLDKISLLVRGMRDALDNAAHDLRTPMTRLRAVAETALRPGKTAEERAEALSDCLEESDRVLALLTSLMDVSEAEAGTLRLSMGPADLRRLAGEAAEVYRYPAEEKRIEISVAAGPPVKIVCDSARVRQAVANLLDNAVKYTPAGGKIALDLRTEPGWALLSVSDTGPGIPAEDLDRIWERLYRGDASRSQKGLGLGLSLVRAVMKAHGGEALASSSQRGTTFTLRFPAPPAAP